MDGGGTGLQTGAEWVKPWDTALESGATKERCHQRTVPPKSGATKERKHQRAEAR